MITVLISASILSSSTSFIRYMMYCYAILKRKQMYM